MIYDKVVVTEKEIDGASSLFTEYSEHCMYGHYLFCVGEDCSCRRRWKSMTTLEIKTANAKRDKLRSTPNQYPL